MARVQIYQNPDVDFDAVREILGRYEPRKNNVMGVLQDVQARFGYVPEEACALIARTLRVPLSQIFGVLTFYGFFRLKPRGKYTIRVCVGTACHVKGAEIVGQAIQREIGLAEMEDTTDDGMFTYEEVACIGACGLAPLVLGERTPAAAWVAIAAGLAGVALILDPAGEWNLGAAAALFAALASAGAHLMVRRLNRTDEPLVIVANFTLITGLLTLVPAALTFQPMNGRQWLVIAAVALLATCGQILMTNAYRRDRAPAVAAASYSSLVLSVVYGYLFWDEIPGPRVIAGGFFILAGGLFLLKSRYGREEAA